MRAIAQRCYSAPPEALEARRATLTRVLPAVPTAVATAVVIPDVVEGSIYMWDQHRGWRPDKNASDCLHYCVPGPTTLWADQLGLLISQNSSWGRANGG